MTVASSQGTTISFAGILLGNIVGVNGSFATNAKEIRPLAYNITPDTEQYLSTYEQTTCDQTVELEALADVFDVSMVGTKGPLSVNGNGWSFSFGTAFLENMKLTAKVGDVLRINYSFKRSYE